MANPNFGPEYKLIREISSGGMGIVYLAEDHQLGRPVAIKVLREEFARDQASVDRFLNEARSMAALDHSNIVPVYRAVQSQSGPFFTMKFIDGQDLRTVLDNHGSFKIQDALQIIEAVGGALDYAHSKGLVHRDVKPANILMDANGVPWVGDFGIVRVVGKTGHTMTGMMVGTPEYMAPEQWDDVKYGEISGATDRYALGIMFYEMLVGNPPFSATNPMAVGVAHLNNQFPKLSLSSSQGLTNRLQPFLNRMTSKRSADRYQTCKAFSDDIRRALKDGPAPRGKNNSTGLYAVAGLAGIVAIAAIGMSMSGRSGPEVSSGVTGGGSNTSIGGGTSSGNGISTPASGEQVKEGEVVKPVERHSRNVSASELYFRPSSVLRDPVGDHTGELTMDGKDETAWEQGPQNGGEGEYLRYLFKNGQSHQISAIRIIDGYKKQPMDSKTHQLSWDRWYGNNRARKVTVQIGSNAPYTKSLDPDNKNFQDIGPSSTMTGTEVKLTFSDIVYGSRSRDLCISEVQIEVSE